MWNTTKFDQYLAFTEEKSSWTYVEYLTLNIYWIFLFIILRQCIGAYYILVYLHAIWAWQGARNSFHHVISLQQRRHLEMRCIVVYPGLKNAIEEPLSLEDRTMRKILRWKFSLLQWVYVNKFSNHSVLLLCTFGTMNFKWWIIFGFNYFPGTFSILLGINSIYLLFTIIKITVLSRICYLRQFKKVQFPRWTIHNAFRHAHNSRYHRYGHYSGLLEKR